MLRRLTAIGAGLLVVASVLSSADSGSAQEPQLTTRVMIAWDVERSRRVPLLARPAVHFGSCFSTAGLSRSGTQRVIR